MRILPLLWSKSSWGPYSSSQKVIRSMGTWRGQSSKVRPRGTTVILTARPTHTLCCASTPLNVSRIRKSQRPCATGPPQVRHSTNVPPLSMVYQQQEKMASLRIWSLSGNVCTAVTNPCFSQKTKVKFSRVCSSCSRKSCTPHFQDNSLTLHGYLFKQDPISIPYETIKF